MGTAPIADIQSFFPGAPVTEPAGRPVQSNDMFAKAMSDAAVKTAPAADMAKDPEAVKQAPGAGSRIIKADNADAKRLDNNGSETDTGYGKDTGVKGDRKEEIAGRIEEKADEIAGAIKDELGISDEEFEAAMAFLGLVPADLLDTGNIKDLMLELSGEPDPLTLITNEELLASINSITDLVSEAVDEISEEFGITADEVISLAKSIEISEDTNIITEAVSEDIPAVYEDAKSDDESDDGSDVKPVRVEVTRTDDNADIRQTPTQEGASIERRASEVLKDRKQDDGMQEGMPGQGYQTGIDPSGEAVPAVTEMPASYADTEEILKQVTDYMKVNIGTDASSMELQLHPASLGTVNIQIASNNGVITANLLVQNETVKAALETQLVQLLETFEEQGQKVEAIEVSVAGYDLDRSLNQNDGSGTEDRKEQGSEAVGKVTRRRLNLNELDEEDIEELSEEEQLAAEMMTLNGGSVDYLA